MKKNILTFALIFSSYLGFSQIEKFDLVFTYKVKAKFYKDILEGNANENMILLIGKNNSLYMSPSRYKIDSARLAIKSRKGDIYELLDYESKFPDYILNSSVFKHFKNNKLHFDRKADNVSFRIEEEIPRFNWKIKNKFKEILNYKCQLAILNYKGRDYEAWFTTKIPLQNGPWKFGGLPGLIVQIYDTTDQFSFKLIGVSKKKHTYVRNKSKIIIVKNKNLLKSVRNYYKQSLNEVMDGEGKETIKRNLNKFFKLLEIKNNIELE